MKFIFPIACAAIFLLTACGQKGPLYLPKADDNDSAFHVPSERNYFIGAGNRLPSGLYVRGVLV